MTRLHRFLFVTNSTTTADSATSSESVSVESDFVVILAALLCAVICVIGLITMARCSWLRRGTVDEVAGRLQRKSVANKGLNKKTLQSISVTTYDISKEGFEAECAICLAEYVSGEDIRVLPQCGHGFHVVCIDTWLGSHSSCPSCRHVLSTERCRECGEVSVGGDMTGTQLKSTPEVGGSSEFLP